MQRIFALTAALMIAAFLLAACEEQGPAEELGERVDDAIDEAGDRLEDARDEAEEAADEVRDALNGE